MFSLKLTNTSASPPSVGWMLDAQSKVAQYATLDEAEAAARKWRRDGRYSWNRCKIEAAETKGERNDHPRA